jgi:hypothetical protein
VNDGGPAFPRVGHVMSQDCEPEQWKAGHEGMSLRDYFAGQVLNGIVAARTIPATGPDCGNKMARAAYHVADAMLEQREKEAK